MENKKYAYACLMLKVDFKNWNLFCDDFINPEHVYTEDSLGIEKEPHITILYGLHPEEVSLEEVKGIIPEKLHNIEFKLVGIDIFENEKFDVVKFEIESNDLRKLNLICKTLPHTSSFPDYKPHLTIFYCKKGFGKEYIKKINPIELESNIFLYSSPKDGKITFSV